MSEKMRLIMPGKPEYIKVTEIAVEAAAAQAGFDIDAVDDIKLAVGEGCKHVICHGYEKWCRCYQVDCEAQEDRIIIVISEMDCGHQIRKTGKICMDCPREGDLGIHVIKTLMDEVDIYMSEENKKVVKMVKKK